MAEGPLGGPRPLAKENSYIVVEVQQPLEGDVTEGFDRFEETVNNVLANGNFRFSIKSVEQTTRPSSTINALYVGPVCSVSNRGMRSTKAKCYIGLIPNGTDGITPFHISQLHDAMKSDLSGEFGKTMGNTTTQIVPEDNIPRDINLPSVSTENRSVF